MSILTQEIPRIVDFESLPTDISVNFNNNLSMEIVQGRGFYWIKLGVTWKTGSIKPGLEIS